MHTPGSAAADPSIFSPFARILCAIDQEQPSQCAQALAGLLATRFGAHLDTFYVETGRPAPVIVERAISSACDLIVLGSRDRSDLGWQFRDDVVREVSALTECATLTVRERDMGAALQRILVPVDLGPATAAALQWATAIALAFQAEVQLLHVVSRERSSERTSDRTALAELTQGLVALGVDASFHVVAAGGPAIGIETFNDQGEFDLVVMGLDGSPHSEPRHTRGVTGTLRSRMSVPLLSVRSTTLLAKAPSACVTRHRHEHAGLSAALGPSGPR